MTGWLKGLHFKTVLFMMGHSFNTALRLSLIPDPFSLLGTAIKMYLQNKTKQVEPSTMTHTPNVLEEFARV
jgi:hypothetical protein